MQFESPRFESTRSESIMGASNLAMLRLLQIVSPSLPTGAFSYSQGLEWAVDAGWVTDKESFTVWLKEQLDGTMTQQELPLLRRLYSAYLNRDSELSATLCATVIALRETTELRDEERQRGRAMLALASELNSEISQPDIRGRITCQLGVFAQYCACEQIPADLTLQGYTYAWLESQVMAAVKLVPLGQTVGQQILYALSAGIEPAISSSKNINDDDIGYSNPAQLFASCQHETQYSRLFRS